MIGRFRRCVALFVPFLVVAGCDNSSPAERELVHTDAEVFEAVARAERIAGAEDSSRVPLFLRIDSRPIDNTGLLMPQNPGQTGITIGDDSAEPSSGALRQFVRERRAILDRLAIEEGGPFYFPGCGGVRTGESAPKPGKPSGSSCPTEWRRYVTIGLPRRGVGQIPEKVRQAEPRSFDTGEVWSVLVTETSIGVGGQDWKHYAWVLTRERGRADMSLAARFLLSWAE